MILFDLDVVLDFAREVRWLGERIEGVVEQCGGLEDRVVQSCVGGFVEMFEEKMRDLLGVGRFLEEELFRVAGGLERSGYEADGLLSQVIDYSVLGFLAVQADTGGVCRLGDVFDVMAARVTSGGKVQADTEVLREVARVLRSAPSEVLGGVSSCESVYEYYKYQGGRLVPVCGMDELFVPIRSWVDDFGTLADWLDKKAAEFDDTQNGVFLKSSVGFTASVSPTPSPTPGPKPVVPDSRRGSDARQPLQVMKLPEWDTVREFVGIPHTWNMGEWSSGEWFDAISWFPVGGWAAKGGKFLYKAGDKAYDFIKGLRKTKNADNADNLKHVDNIEVKKLPTKEQALKNATRTLDDNAERLDTIIKKSDGTLITAKDGYYGVRGKKSKTRTVNCEDPEQTAKKFFNTATEGGGSFKADGLSDGGKSVIMKDGTTITYRPTSSGYGTNRGYGEGGAVVQIDNVPEGSILKNQKIHFEND